jgi:hypothetical protein
MQPVVTLTGRKLTAELLSRFTATSASSAQKAGATSTINLSFALPPGSARVQQHLVAVLSKPLPNVQTTAVVSVPVGYVSSSVKLEGEEGQEAHRHDMTPASVMEQLRGYTNLIALRAAAEPSSSLSPSSTRVKVHVSLMNPEDSSDAATSASSGSNSNSPFGASGLILPPSAPKKKTASSSSNSSESLIEAFLALENAVASDVIDSYGVCSNGLSLPATHPLHYPLSSIPLNDERFPNFTQLHFPVNLMERSGLDVAKQAKSLMPSVKVYATRPLSYYPDGGVASEDCFKLVDYKMESGNEQNDSSSTQDVVLSSSTILSQLTHEVSKLPASYQAALSEALGYFDAEEIIENAVNSSSLSEEEVETIKGCRMLQAMLSEMDSKVSTWRTFAKYEEELMADIIPTIHSKFEELDETSALVLHSFFKEYSNAVRWHVAKNVRGMLKDGDKSGGNGENGGMMMVWDVPKEVSLQDFALKNLLEMEGIIDGVVVGASSAEQIDWLNKYS